GVWRTRVTRLRRTEEIFGRELSRSYPPRLIAVRTPMIPTVTITSRRVTPRRGRKPLPAPARSWSAGRGCGRCSTDPVRARHVPSPRDHGCRRGGPVGGGGAVAPWAAPRARQADASMPRGAGSGDDRSVRALWCGQVGVGRSPSAALVEPPCLVAGLVFKTSGTARERRPGGSIPLLYRFASRAGGPSR